jgi:photosystem II stability/assembly factor-like uncharacterized protein
VRRLWPVLALLLAGCSSPPATGNDVEVTDLHGIGYLPATNQVLLASHHGLVIGTKDRTWSWDYAGSERYDYMGFTQDSVTPTTMYSSGHPNDPREYGGVHLGLRRSTDSGVTWEQRSLKGQVDFHELTSIPGTEGGLVGIWKDKIMESRDGGLSWINHTGPSYLMFGIAVTDHHTYVATSEGLAGGHPGNASSWERHSDPEPGRLAMAVNANHNGSLMFAGTGNGRSGSSYRSTDGGHTWAKIAEEALRDAAVPILFAFDPSDDQHVLSASAGGHVMESRDAGLTWSTLRRA